MLRELHSLTAFEKIFRPDSQVRGKRRKFLHEEFRGLNSLHNIFSSDHTKEDEKTKKYKDVWWAKLKKRGPLFVGMK